MLLDQEDHVGEEIVAISNLPCWIIRVRVVQYMTELIQPITKKVDCIATE